MTRARDLADSADKDIAGTLTLDGLVVDDITIDGSTISDGGDFTLDVGGDITLDADGADIRLKDGGTEFAILHNSGYFGVYSTISDADLKIQGNDGGSLIDALTFDMSQAGRAIFNEGVVCKSSTGGDFGVNINTASGDSMKLQVVDTGSAGAANGVISVSDGDLILSPSANVGIGESSPLSNLHIEDTSGAVLTLGNSQDPNDVVAGTVFGRINFYASDRSGATNATGGVARIEAIASSGYSSSTPSDLLFYTHGASANDGSVLGNPSERLRIDSSGNVLVGTTDSNVGDNTGSARGINLNGPDGQILAAAYQASALILNRMNNDGQIVSLRQNGTEEGSISVSGSTVSFNGFAGRHESSGIPTTTPKGTVVSTIDELDVYLSGSKEGQTRADHAKVEVSNSEGDACVYGVVDDFTDDGSVNVVSVGIASVLVTGACSKGDLLESNGDGTAKVQSDDIIRSKTIGKVTISDSNTGVKLVSCVMYCG